MTCQPQVDHQIVLWKVSPTLSLRSKYGQQYQCKLPDVTSFLLEAAQRENALDSPVTISSLLEPLYKRPCLHKVLVACGYQDWWTYELCYGHDIKQYHKQEGQIVGAVITLGRYEGDFNWDNISLKWLLEKPRNGYLENVLDPAEQIPSWGIDEQSLDMVVNLHMVQAMIIMTLSREGLKQVAVCCTTVVMTDIEQGEGLKQVAVCCTTVVMADIEQGGTESSCCVQTSSTPKYHSQTYVNGSRCDLIDVFRSAEVRLGVIYYELLQPNETITRERYQQQLMRLSRALKIKRPLYAKRHDKVIYQHDNAWPHVAKVVKETLEALQWDVLPHPLYSPDIAPLDYHMFRSMTHGLAEQHFTSYEEAKNWVNVWIASKYEEFFRHRIRMLPERWEKVYFCEEDSPDYIARVDEPSTCNYVVHVHTQRLCSHPFFKPRPQSHTISCSPLVTSEQYQKYIQKVKDEIPLVDQLKLLFEDKSHLPPPLPQQPEELEDQDTPGEDDIIKDYPEYPSEVEETPPVDYIEGQPLKKLNAHKLYEIVHVVQAMLIMVTEIMQKEEYSKLLDLASELTPHEDLNVKPLLENVWTSFLHFYIMVFENIASTHESIDRRMTLIRNLKYRVQANLAHIMEFLGIEDSTAQWTDHKLIDTILNYIKIVKNLEIQHVKWRSSLQQYHEKFQDHFKKLINLLLKAVVQVPPDSSIDLVPISKNFLDMFKKYMQANMEQSRLQQHTWKTWSDDNVEEVTEKAHLLNELSQTEVNQENKLKLEKAIRDRLKEYSNLQNSKAVKFDGGTLKPYATHLHAPQGARNDYQWGPAIKLNGTPDHNALLWTCVVYDSKARIHTLPRTSPDTFATVRSSKLIAPDTTVVGLVGARV
ncbi:hypothetical protein LAZ67_10002852 [Cordylochernes scorpioides]|uniref:Protein OS9-like domain-containing protein n=1 Tax=Cordylochernes scorpioides TaxID=51811 RepID=A0ABY6KWV8_9ARAC|nr:hypothetical protein LAZ67_10002852 [Cordylochernes scorpioides]